MEYDQNFTPLSLKINFLSSSENGRNFNIFDNASTFGLEFCNCLKDDNAVESIFIILYYNVIKHSKFHTSVFKNKVFMII